ncbi:MAG: DUF2147 domain-containing protein [Pseudomonadota bacterium]
MRRPALLLACVLGAPLAWADGATPVGLWQNLDDASGKPKALIRITDQHGALSGRIEKLYRAPGEDPSPRCDQCEGANKDQPVLGMVIMSGLRKSGDDYSGGQILDPDNGKLYKSKLSLSDDGKRLTVRGYIGMPLLGRSQVWLRQE